MKPAANELQRKRLELFARIVNIESLSDLKEWEKLQLVEEARQAEFSWLAMKPSWKALRGRQLRMWELHQGKTKFLHDCHPRIFESWPKERLIPFEWEALLETHEWGRLLVHDLLDGKEVSIDSLRRFEPKIRKFNPETGRLRYSSSNENPALKLQIAFGEALTQEPFPFRRCPVNDCSKVFVPGKNQKYCSAACTSRGIEAARKDKKREYMRKYMADRRKKA